MTTITSEQVLALAPDAASAKAGAALATPRKWAGTGRDETGVIVWGACQGSGAKPYQVQVDLGAPAFHCSCPSRKFPCKHALGVLLLLVAMPDHVPTSAVPPWVREWLDSREQRAEKKAARQETRSHTSEGPVDVEAQQRRAAAREEKVARGVGELALWLRDIIRAGLAIAHSRPAAFCDEMAARLVDAQAPGAARLVRQLGASRTSGEGWHARMLLQLSRLHLLAESYQRLDTLPTELQATVRARMGFTTSDAELTRGPTVGDRWIVIGQVVLDDETLRARRTWLMGVASGRIALLLHFAHAKVPFADALPPVGGELTGELAFFPGDVYRATIRSRDDSAYSAATTVLSAAARHLRDATAPFATALARDPWTEQVPLVVHDVVPTVADGRWLVRDGAGDVIPVSPRFQSPWLLLALSGGNPVFVSGEWNGDDLLPLAVGVDGRLVPLDAPVRP